MYYVRQPDYPPILMVPGVDQLFLAQKLPGSVGGDILFSGVFETPDISSLTWTFTSADLSTPLVISFPAQSCPSGQCSIAALVVIGELHHPYHPGTAASLTVNL